MTLQATKARAKHDWYSFADVLKRHGIDGLTREPLKELQVNIGRLCNQACNHCHVDAGPKRPEVMTRSTMQRILEWSKVAGIEKADLTGGAPELNPHFRWFVDGFLSLNTRISARCNLTVLMEPGQEDLAAWYAERRVHLIGSLPCYTRKNVEAQRGKGVFDKSIDALGRLNKVGYGREDALALDLDLQPRRCVSAGPTAKARIGLQDAPAGRLRCDLFASADHH